MIAQMMPIDSVKSRWMKPITSDSTAARSRIRMIGSRNLSSKSSQAEASFGGVMTLSPCRSRLAATSCGARPRGL